MSTVIFDSDDMDPCPNCGSVSVVVYSAKTWESGSSFSARCQVCGSSFIHVIPENKSLAKRSGKAFKEWWFGDGAKI